MELADVADEIYGLAPEEFTKTRNERAKEIRGEDRALSDAVKKLPKPSTAAWVVNMLVRHEAEMVENVLSLGVALREAQENLAGDELRELTRQRRQLTSAVTSRARALARELGVKVSSDIAEQVEETLRAAMADENAAKAVRTGQLVDALSATGVGDLDVSDAVAVPEAIGMTARPKEKPVPAGETPAGERPDLKVVEEPEPDEAAERERALEQARSAAEEASEAAAKAARKLEKAEKRVSRLEARSLQLQAELDELRRRASNLEHQLETVDDELSEAEEKRERARERDEAARAAVEEAQGTLAELEA